MLMVKIYLTFYLHEMLYCQGEAIFILWIIGTGVILVIIKRTGTINQFTKMRGLLSSYVFAALGVCGSLSSRPSQRVVVGLVDFVDCYYWQSYRPVKWQWWVRAPCWG